MIAHARDRDWILSLASAVGLAAVVAVLAVDVGAPRHARALSAVPQIARLVFAGHGVRRRPVGTLVWDEVRTGEVLHDQDTLFVAPGGSAQVAFDDGSTLDLDQSSLVVLERPSGELRGPATVALVKGEISGNSGERGLTIRGGGGLTELSGRAQARVAVEAPDRARIEVFAGTATVTTSSGRGTLAADQAGAIGSGGHVETAAAPRVKLESPGRNARAFFAGTPGPVDLRWESASADLWVQVAHDRAFAAIAATAPAAAGSHAFTPPAAGIYYWRVADGQGAALSEVRRLAVIEDVPPQPASPMPDEIVLAPDDRPVPFAWSPVPGVSHYRLEVSTDASFASLAAAEQPEAPGVWVRRPLPEGEYHWRVRADEADRGASPYSRPLSFRLIRKPLPAAPELYDTEIEVNPGGPPPQTDAP